MELADDGDPETPCSAASAVVATAFALPGVPAKGIRPDENRDDDDIRDAREPDLRGMGTAAPCAVDAVCVGEGGGGDVAEGGVGDLAGSTPSPIFSTGAWASRRDNEEGPAAVKEVPRPREVNSCEVGDREGKGSSTSGSRSGGPGVGSGVVTAVGVSDALGEVLVFFAVRRLDV